MLVALIRNLDPAGRPMLRIGGQSADRSWWPVPGMSRPLGVTYDLGPSWTAATRALARATNARLLLGVNLEANRTRIDRVEATHLVRGIGRRYVAALEIGNEPDLYPAIPWYRRVDGRPAPWYGHAGTLVFSRRFTYGPADFDAEFARTLRVLPPLPIAGPETSNPPWLSAFRRFVWRGSRVRMLTSHAYPLSQCITDPASPGYPSVPNLLSLAASREMLGADLPYVSLAHADGLTYRIDELGSTSCNGRAGVSNSAASALWLMDALFSIAAGSHRRRQPPHISELRQWPVRLHALPRALAGRCSSALLRGPDVRQGRALRLPVAEDPQQQPGSAPGVGDARARSPRAGPADQRQRPVKLTDPAAATERVRITRRDDRAPAHSECVRDERHHARRAWLWSRELVRHAAATATPDLTTQPGPVPGRGSRRQRRARDVGTELI